MSKFTSEPNGTWFFFDDEEKNGGTAIREEPIERTLEIEKDTTTIKRKWERGTGRRYEDKKVDDIKAAKLHWDYVITDWKEVYLDGTLLKCNRDNKYKMMVKSVKFAAHVLESLEKLTEMSIADEEARVKNLKPTSVGGSQK